MISKSANQRSEPPGTGLKDRAASALRYVALAARWIHVHPAAQPDR
jgi:hypothetical protein